MIDDKLKRIEEIENSYPCTNYPDDDEMDCWSENLDAEDACYNCKAGFAEMMLAALGDRDNET